MKKKYLIILCTLLCNLSIYAQTPQAINYQGVARDNSGNVLANQMISLKLSILSGSASGPVVYAETHVKTTDGFGLFALKIGQGTLVSGTFTAISWGTDSYYLQVEIDPAGGTAFQLVGTNQFVSVPYALYADKSGNGIIEGTAIGQILHWSGTSWAADSGVFSNGKRFGIGISTPDAPLGIKGEAGLHDEMISFDSHDNFQKWNINLNPTGGNLGFSIDDRYLIGLRSRFFIEKSSGRVGIGTITPLEKLDVTDSLPGLSTGIKIRNLATEANQGFILGHIDDNILTQRSGSFGIIEKRGSSLIERITVLPGIDFSGGTFYNVGINEKLPFATLHVSRPAADPQSDISLTENTGILLLGTIAGKNLGFDSHNIQARTGEYIGGTTTLSLTATTLNLQPFGGGIIINSSMADDKKVLITGDGKVGIGKTPIETLDVNGAITIGDATVTSSADGTIRFNGTDFEGRKNGVWKSLTAPSVDDGFGNAGAGKITYNTIDAKVGIGVAQPNAALHVMDSSVVISGNTSVIIDNQSSTSSINQADSRIGLNVTNSGTWSSNASAKNIGLYVSATGPGNANANLGAVINGNVVIGNIIPSSDMVGTNGSNVLVIQNGSVPTTPLVSSSGLSDGGIQIYSGTDITGTSVLIVMNGDGNVIKLYRESALTPADNNTVGSTYGANEANVINNLRTRINELEAKLQAQGLLH
jgi:hypothetical protein